MLDALNRAERYRDLAEECRRLAAASLSPQMRSRFSRIAEDYTTLAEGRTSLRRFAVLGEGGGNDECTLSKHCCRYLG
jgi:hypothetical protein